MNGAGQRCGGHRRVFELDLDVAALVFLLNFGRRNQDALGRQILHALEQNLLLHALFKQRNGHSHSLDAHFIRLLIEHALCIHQTGHCVADFVRHVLVADIEALLGRHTGQAELFDQRVDDDRQITRHHLWRQLPAAGDVVHFEPDIALSDAGIADMRHHILVVTGGVNRVGDAGNERDHHRDGDNRQYRREQVLHGFFTAAEQVEHRGFGTPYKNQRRVPPRQPVSGRCQWD